MTSDERRFRQPSLPHGMDAHLLAYRSGWTTRETFLYELMDSRVLVLVAKTGDADADAAPSGPLVVQRHGGARLVALFSSADLATEWLQTCHDCQAIEVSASQVLAGLPEDHGIVIDPGDGNELDLQPDELAAIRWRLPETAYPGLH